MNKKIYPLKLKPVYKAALWGGNGLRRLFGVSDPLPELAEAWELTVRPDGMNIIENGEYAGKTLGEYLGEDAEKSFPLLVKFIDAGEKLSIQVHPAKTEMWYIVDAAPGAQLVYGTTPGCEEAGLRSAMEEGRLADCMNFVNVRAGETYFIPTGLTHAIGGGILIAEIQENSNVTYRVYDYDRRGADGKLRELHTDAAFKVMKSFADGEIDALRFSEGKVPPSSGELLAACSSFTAVKYRVSGELELKLTDGGAHMLFIGGEGALIHERTQDRFAVRGGDSVYLPDGLDGVKVTGDCEFILSTCPHRK